MLEVLIIIEQLLRVSPTNQIKAGFERFSLSKKFQKEYLIILNVSTNGRNIGLV